MADDSLHISFSEDEDLQDSPAVETLLRIANGQDADSDLDESNTPTEAYEEEMEQGREEPIVISDDSDLECEVEEGYTGSVLATVSLKRKRGSVELNAFVLSAFLGMTAVKVNIKKLTRREINFHCKTNDDEDVRDRRTEAANRPSLSHMRTTSPASTPKKAPKKTESRIRLSSTKKKTSAVKKRSVGERAMKSIFDVDSDSCPSPAAARGKKSKEVENEDNEANDLMSFGTPKKWKLKSCRVPIRHKSKRFAKVLRNLSQEYLREEAEEKTVGKKAMEEEKVRSSQAHDSGSDLPLPPSLTKSQSEMFSSPEVAPEEDRSSQNHVFRSDLPLPPLIPNTQSDMFLSPAVAPQPSPEDGSGSILGKLVNENLSSDEDEAKNSDLEDLEVPSLNTDTSRDRFSQSQKDEADVNANHRLSQPPQVPSTQHHGADVTDVNWDLFFKSQEDGADVNVNNHISQPPLVPSTQSPEANNSTIGDSPQQEEDYQCIFCDETFKEKTDHQKHLKECLQGRPVPSYTKLKRPRSPSPFSPPLAPAPANTSPRSTTKQSANTNSDKVFRPPSFSTPKPKLPKIPKLKGTSEELKAGRLLPQQAKDNEVKRILAKIAVHDDWVKSCWSEAAQNKKAAPALDDEQDRNDLLHIQEELRKLGSDRERRDYFQRKHGNERRADPAVNLSSFSWKPPGQEGLLSEKEGKDALTNGTSYDKDDKVSFEDWRRELVNRIARNVVDKKGLEADEKGIQELALYFAHVRAAQDESQSFWAAYLSSQEMPREQVDLALDIESHVSSYEKIYEGTDEFRCGKCGNPKPHRFNF